MLHDPKMKKTEALFEGIFFFPFWKKPFFFLYCCCFVAFSLNPLSSVYGACFLTSALCRPNLKKELKKKKKKKSLKLKYDEIERNCRKPFGQTTKWFQNEGLPQVSEDDVL